MENKKSTYKKQELPKVWVDEKARNNYRKELTKIETELNGKYRAEIENAGLKFDLELINSFKKSDIAIVDLMEKAFKDYCKNLGFVPKNELARVEQSYIAISQSLEDVNKKIYCHLSRVDCDLISDNGTIQFDRKQVEKHVQTIGVVEFNDTERKYLSMIEDIREKVAELAHFENENGFAPYASTGYVSVKQAEHGDNTHVFRHSLAVDLANNQLDLDRFYRGTHKLNKEQTTDK